MSAPGSAIVPARSRGLRALAAALRGPSDPWTDLGLTLPVFLGYHLGVVFLTKRNAADFMSSALVDLAGQSIVAYMGLTLALGGALVGTLIMVGRGQQLHWKRFVLVLAEGAAYAIAMRTIASYVVGSLRLGAGEGGAFSNLIMALGAGFYEEVAFRVVLFGLGAKLLTRFIKKRPVLVTMGWALVTSLVFSSWHYVGRFGDPLALGSFLFRAVCGIVLVAIFRFRGFAPAVWTHALYDVWVMLL